MPYRKVDPVPESEMRNTKYIHHHTICASLRLLWRRTTDEESKLLCRQAMAYAKRMHERLKYYHDKYEPDRKSYFDGARTTRASERAADTG